MWLMMRAAILLTVLLGVAGQGGYSYVSREPSCEHTRGEEAIARKCAKACLRDRDCRNHNGYRTNKKCVCDGKCGRSCIDTNQRCYPEPTHIQNGKVTIDPYNKFGATATYTCSDGYTINGRAFRVCQGDESWSGEDPRCELNHGMLDEHNFCVNAPVVPHATHNGRRHQSKFEQGTNLKYTCDQGYQQHKDSVNGAWCVLGGVWVGPNITCISRASGCLTPPDIENGYVEMVSATAPGGRVKYSCFNGFFLAGMPERVCQRDGSWDGSEPSCKKLICGPPPDVEHASHDGIPEQMSYAVGTVLSYSCKFGYYSEGSPRAVCNKQSGHWDGPMIICKARDCAAPQEIENGWRDPGYRFIYPTRVKYHCNEGYEMRANAHRTCMASGEWSGDLPECMPIHCRPLNPAQHGTMIGGDATVYRSVIKFVCNSGFKLIGSDERTCQADQTWSGQDATCEEIDCGAPGPIWNGYLDGHRTTVGSVYFYRCNIRSKFVGRDVSTQCTDTGEWSVPVPKCLGQCQVPSIVNGSLRDGRENTWVDHDTVITPECHHGRVLNDSRPVKCDNGTWTMIPRCVPAPCSSPPPLMENGHRVYFRVAHNSRARYYCFSGYELDGGHRYMTCKYGKWHGIRPRCKEDFCDRPGTLKDGSIYWVGSRGKFAFFDYITTIKHGDRLQYECNRSFKLVGPRGAACVDGKWSPRRKPVCVRTRHPEFSKMWKPREESGHGAMFY